MIDPTGAGPDGSGYPGLLSMLAGQNSNFFGPSASTPIPPEIAALTLPPLQAQFGQGQQIPGTGGVGSGAAAAFSPGPQTSQGSPGGGWFRGDPQWGHQDPSTDWIANIPGGASYDAATSTYTGANNAGSWRGPPQGGSWSTNDWRLLPPGYNTPQYIMRNGFIIDRNQAGNVNQYLTSRGMSGVPDAGRGGSVAQMRPGEQRPLGYNYPSGAQQQFFPGQIEPWLNTSLSTY